MAIRDDVTRHRVLQCLYAAIAADTTTNGAVIDTADYEHGISFFASCVAWTDGSYTLLLEEDSDPAFGSPVTIAAAKLIYNSAVTLTAANSDGDLLPREGVHSNERYVRASIVSTSTDQGATVFVGCVKHSEYLPTPQDA